MRLKNYSRANIPHEEGVLRTLKLWDAIRGALQHPSASS